MSRPPIFKKLHLVIFDGFDVIEFDADPGTIESVDITAALNNPFRGVKSELFDELPDAPDKKLVRVVVTFVAPLINIGIKTDDKRFDSPQFNLLDSGEKDS